MVWETVRINKWINVGPYHVDCENEKEEIIKEGKPKLKKKIILFKYLVI